MSKEYLHSHLFPNTLDNPTQIQKILTGAKYLKSQIEETRELLNYYQELGYNDKEVSALCARLESQEKSYLELENGNSCSPTTNNTIKAARQSIIKPEKAPTINVEPVNTAFIDAPPIKEGKISTLKIKEFKEIDSLYPLLYKQAVIDLRRKFKDGIPVNLDDILRNHVRERFLLNHYPKDFVDQINLANSNPLFVNTLQNNSDRIIKTDLVNNRYFRYLHCIIEKNTPESVYEFVLKNPEDINEEDIKEVSLEEKMKMLEKFPNLLQTARILLNETGVPNLQDAIAKGRFRKKLRNAVDSKFRKNKYSQVVLSELELLKKDITAMEMLSKNQQNAIYFNDSNINVFFHYCSIYADSLERNKAFN